MLRVLSFNLRTDTAEDGPFHWNARLPAVREFLKRQPWDVLCVQEASAKMVADLAHGLPGVSAHGTGREIGGHGELCAVFLRSARFSFMREETTWLSEQPLTPGSRSWDTACTRIQTWVEALDAETGLTWWFGNTHWDHVSELARFESARLCAWEVRHRGPRAVLVGDFNAEPDSPEMQRLLTECEEQTLFADVPTFHDFFRGGTERIDHGVVPIRCAASLEVLEEPPVAGLPLSDHHPVLVTLGDLLPELF